MMSGSIAVTLIAVELLLLFFLAMKQKGILRVLLCAQFIYWAISYLLRPLLLLLVKPMPNRGDSVADVRLAADGYEGALSGVLSLVAFGLALYLVCVYVLIRLFARSPATSMEENSAELITVFFIALTSGWLARLFMVSAPENELLDLGSYFAVIGSFGLLVKYRSRGSGVLLAVIMSGEVLWSVLSTSKTPLLAAALALALRLLSHGLSRKKLAGVLGLGMGSFVLFSVVQGTKINDVISSELELAESTYPAIVRPFMDLARRFDLLSAATDAYFAGQGNWLSLREFADRAVAAFVPGPLYWGEKVTAGRAWAEEVRALSLPGAGVDVSLADGFIAEGWVVGGPFGVFLEALLCAALTLGAARMVAKGSPGYVALAACMLSFPILFERGALGSLSVIGKSFQAIVILVVVSFLVRSLLRARGQVQQPNAGR